MNRRRRMAHVGIRVAISVASALIMAAIFAGTGDAGALTARSGSVIVAVAPSSRLADGQPVTIRAASAAGIDIYQVRAHLCSAGKPVRTNFDFGFQGRRCANVALGRGDLEQTVEFGGGVNKAEIKSFKVGAGEVHWVNELGFDQTQECGVGHPCDLVVRVQITDDTLFFTTPVCYGAGCPAAAPDPEVLIPTPTSTSTTVHPTSTTTPTSAPVPAAVGGGAQSSQSGGASARRAAGAGAAATARRAPAAKAKARTATADKTARAAAPKSASDTLEAATGGLSQNQRVLLAALAGALGSAWIVSIFLRGRALLVPVFTRKELTW